MVIVYHGNFYEAKRCSHRPLDFELTRLLLETMILHVICSGLEATVIKTCAKLYHFFHGVVRARYEHTSEGNMP